MAGSASNGASSSVEQLRISGAGTVCAVGWDRANACASIRAGITRLTGTPGFFSDDDESLFPDPLMTASITGLTDGYGLLGTWTRLLQLCVADAIQTTFDPRAGDRHDEKNTAIVLLCPNLAESERLGADEGLTSDDVKNSMAAAFGTSISVTAKPENIFCVAESQAGILKGLRIATELLKKAGIRYVFVMGVDCFVGPEAIAWAAMHERLKTADMPAGFIPGEAAGCLVFESDASIRDRRGRVLGSITRLAECQDAGCPASRGKGVPGLAVANAIKGMLNGRARFSGSIISDGNGESWRAMQLGTILSECSNELSDDIDISYPCVSTGEIGAAYGPIALSQAAHAFERGYNRADQVMILCSSDDGRSGVVEFQGPG